MEEENRKLTPVHEETQEKRYEIPDRRSAAELPARLSARELCGDAVAALKRLT